MDLKAVTNSMEKVHALMMMNADVWRAGLENTWDFARLRRERMYLFPLTAALPTIIPCIRDAKAKDDKPLGVVDAYVKENTTELVDPLDVKKKLELLEEKRNILLTELDTQIKVSNATTFIEIA